MLGICFSSRARFVCAFAVAILASAPMAATNTHRERYAAMRLASCQFIPVFRLGCTSREFPPLDMPSCQ